MHPAELQKHILATYLNLRIGVAIITIAFPLLLLIGGAIQHVPFEGSMSAYYHAVSEDGKSMRTWFVGILFAVGVILYLYKGYSQEENWFLNFAGLFAVGVAIFPMDWPSMGRWPTMHGTCALLLFFCLAWVCIRCASNTLYLFDDKDRERRYRIRYKFIGILMLLFPLIALALTIMMGRRYDSYAFIAEAVGLWVFASYWLLKSRELSSTNAELLALHEKL